MLKPAQLYRERLNIEVVKTWYDLDSMYWQSDTGSCELDIPDNNFEWHTFVSVDDKDTILGYITYHCNWNSRSADRFGIISFKKGSPIFGKDVYTAIHDIFYKFNMNRAEWMCFDDNPAIKSYRNFIRQFGGVECGHYRQTAKLMDGKFHDATEFEILREDIDKMNQKRIDNARKLLKEETLKVIKSPNYVPGPVAGSKRYIETIESDGPLYYRARCKQADEEPSHDATIEWWTSASGSVIKEQAAIALVIAEETFNNIANAKGINVKPLTYLDADGRARRIRELVNIAKLSVTKQLAKASIETWEPQHVDENCEYDLTVLGMLFV